LKTAKVLLKEFLQHVRPAEGYAISLMERPPSHSNKQNWISGVKPMNPDAAKRYIAKVTELEKSDPVIDWTGIADLAGGRRHIARYYSEIETLD